MKIYQYLAKPPITDFATIDRQFRLAVEYQRALTEIEIRRRKAVDQLYLVALPVEHAECAEAERLVEAAVLSLRTARSDRAIRSEKGDEEVSRQVKEALETLQNARKVEKIVREKKRAARKAITSTLKSALRVLDKIAYAEKKAAYNDSAFADLIWGTKLAVGESVERAAKASALEGTFPKLPHFDGSGAIVVQLQGGLSPKDMDDDTRFRLEVVDFATWMERREVARRARVDLQPAEWSSRAARRGNGVVGNDGRPLPEPKEDRGQHAFAHLRIGSEGRAPVWASWPVRISRPLPEGGTIKWARMHAGKIGTRIEWKLQITVDEPEIVKRLEGKILAVNLGWRNLEDGGIRVAYAVDSEGREEEIRVPERFLQKIAHVEHLRSIRDRLCDEMHRMLQDWIHAHEGSLPEWLVEATRWMQNWRGPKQLARLIREWEHQRFETDVEIFKVLSLWRNGKDDQGHSVGNHHLRFWESDEREKAYRHRNEVYRQVALRWASEYSYIFVTDMDLRDFAEEPAPEEGSRSEGGVQRRTRSLAGPSILRAEIKNACASKGSIFEEKKGAWTEICAACGVRERFDAKHQLVRTCGACGKIDDQDANHAKCLLASAWGMRDHEGPLAPSERREKTQELERSGRWKRRRSRGGTHVLE